MRILFLAPQPFYQERGTPIAVRLAVEVLSKRPGDSVDLLTYHEGEEVQIPGVTLHRISVWGWLERLWLSRVGPGISIKKLVCDLFFLVHALRLAWLGRGEDGYRLVHAVEESVFIAWIIQRLWSIPYLYDMDSSLALQVAEKWWWLRPIAPLLEYLERRAVKESLAVVPVCDALAAIAARHGSRFTTVLSDISLLDMPRAAANGAAPATSSAADASKPSLHSAVPARVNLRKEMHIPHEALVLLYIGNLERYQGIELLVRSFARVAAKFPSAHLAVIGGNEGHVTQYRTLVATLPGAAQIHFLGPRPVSLLNAYLREASILVSPRVLGNNTPMKIYSYLHSGIPVLATDLPTHTQVLTEEVACLAAASEEEFGHGMALLLGDEGLRRRLGAAAQALAESKYTFAQFERTLSGIYDRVRTSVGQSSLTVAEGAP